MNYTTLGRTDPPQAPEPMPLSVALHEISVKTGVLIELAEAILTRIEGPGPTPKQDNASAGNVTGQTMRAVADRAFYNIGVLHNVLARIDERL